MNEKVEIIKKALDDKKATNIEVLDVSQQTSLGDYFIVASCQSTVQVRACIDEVEEKLKIKFPEGDYDTLGGFIIIRLGYLPKESDEKGKNDKEDVVEYENFRFTVLNVEERRISKVKVEILPQPEPEETEE